MCVCVRAHMFGGGVVKVRLITHVKKGKPTNKSVQRSFHMFSIEIWWIFCHRAFEVIAEHTVQRNAPLGHCLCSLCCHLHCALLTLCFSIEQHPTPQINASLGPVLAVSRGGEHISCLFRHKSHTQTFSMEEKLLRSPKPGYCLTAIFSHPSLYSRARVHLRVFLFFAAYPWSVHVIVKVFYAAFNHISPYEKTNLTLMWPFNVSFNFNFLPLFYC